MIRNQDYPARPLAGRCWRVTVSQAGMTWRPTIVAPSRLEAKHVAEVIYGVGSVRTASVRHDVARHYA